MASFILRSGFKTVKVPILPSSVRRIASTVTAESNDRIIWNKARPYEEIPGPKPFPVVGNLFQFIPGIGIMGDKDTLIHQRKLMNKYGKIVKVSRIPGRRDMVFLFDPKYFEEMYRNEGQWPARDGVQSLTYYRKVHRKEFFQGVGGLLTDMLYHLSKNPDKQEHLFKELLKFLPNPSDEITAEIIEDMKYFKCCVKESMRLSGVAGLNMRATVKDTVIGNYRIPPNVNVILPHLLAGQLDENFPLASRYIPERWLKSRPNGDSESFGSPEDFDKTKAFKTNPFTFMPFGFGPRICIGKRFAVLELTILMIKMIRNFQVEYNYGEMEYDTQLAHKPLSPLKFKLTDRII